MRSGAALACALALSCGAGALGDATGDSGALSVALADLDGIDAALAELRGRGVLLNLWALWCAPCIAELPELMRVAREAAPEGRVVLVSYDLIVPHAERDEVLGRVTEFARGRGYDVPILIYDAPDFEAIDERFDLPGGVPVTLAIDAAGRIVDVQDGPADEARFRGMMQRALGRQ